MKEEDDDTPTPLRVQRKRDLTAGEVATIDASRKKDYEKRFKVYGLGVELHESSLAKLTYWRVFDTVLGTVRTCGFDVDMDRLLTRLAEGKSFDRIDLFKGTRFPVSTKGPADTQTNAAADAPLCVICGTPGGLPCPSMVAGALSSGFKLAVPAGHPALATKHVHPGRCRKRLREHLDAADAAAATASHAGKARAKSAT